MTTKSANTECKSWSQLPVDILNLFTPRLDIISQIRFRSVCRRWRQAQIVRLGKNLPWLMGHCWGNEENSVLSLCSVHIPLINETHTITNKIEGKAWSYLHGSFIAASKYGWLLLQKFAKTFFYNPLTMEIIQLPEMEMISFNRASFSAAPNSPGCVCFAIQSSKDSDLVFISTCSPGDKEWRTVILYGFYKSIEDVVYSNGNFFCVFNGGLLGAYRIEDHNWVLLTDMEPIIEKISPRSRTHLVESNGDLLLVCPCETFKVFVFVWEDMTWKKLQRLQKMAIFLGCTSFSVPAEEEEEASDIVVAGRIYYHKNEHTISHLLVTGEEYRCPIYHWRTEQWIERIWIQPLPH